MFGYRFLKNQKTWVPPFIYGRHSFKTWPGGQLGPRPGFRVLTGSSGRSSQLYFFWKNQNDVVLVKKKSTGLRPGLVGSTESPDQPDGSAGSHRVFPSFIFSSTRPGSSLGLARSRVDPQGRARFQNYGGWTTILAKQ